MNGTPLRFIIQKHKTRHPHYDLRLETGEGLKSWILLHKPPAKNQKRLAIEDVCQSSQRDAGHALRLVSEQTSPNDRGRVLDSIASGDVIEDGYGSGKAEVWDSGTYRIKTRSRSRIILEGEGKKFSGRFIILLPSWGRKSKKPLWVLLKY